MRMFIRKKKKKNLLLKLIAIIVVSVICSFLLIRYYSNNISPFFMTYAEDEIRRLTTLVVNDSVNNDFFDELEDDKIYNIVKSDSGEIQLITYNAKNVNIWLNSISIMIQNNLKAIENGNIEFLNLEGSFISDYDGELLKDGIVCEIPFGALFNNSLISNIGPKIPVRFNLLGNVNTDLKTNIKEYGINNALLEVFILVDVNIRVNLPFVSDNISISSNLPVSVKLIQGTIPDFYNGVLQSSFNSLN